MLHRILGRVKRAVLGAPGDHRRYLFDELRDHLQGRPARRVLEIGPKDGLDTRRLLTLEPERLTLVDLPRLEASNRVWLQQLDSPRIQYVSANLMYSAEVAALPPFDVVWCTGVLYHNPEQLRFVRRLYDLLVPGGILVLESATIRRRRLRRENCVEIIYPPSEETKQRYHLSANITHLPSARAIASWLAMVGFDPVCRSACHGRISGGLAAARAAFLATKPRAPRPGAYYRFPGEDGYELGKSL